MLFSKFGFYVGSNELSITIWILSMIIIHGEKLKHDNNILNLKMLY